MNQEIPKQFLHVNDKPIIVYTIEAFQRHPSIEFICVVCLEGWVEILKAYIKQYKLDKVKTIITGGDTGQESIYKGLMAVADYCDREDIVLVHDAIRPMVSQDIISDCIAKTQIHGSAIAVIPCMEAMLLSESNARADVCVDRSTLKRTQTPQGFYYHVLREAHDKANERGIKNAIASCTLMITLGETVYFSKGSELNIKITTMEDLEIFKALLTMKG